MICSCGAEFATRSAWEQHVRFVARWRDVGESIALEPLEIFYRWRQCVEMFEREFGVVVVRSDP